MEGKKEKTFCGNWFFACKGTLKQSWTCQQSTSKNELQNPESKDPHPIPKPFKILSFGEYCWPDFTTSNVIHNPDRSEGNICSWSRKCNISTHPNRLVAAWRDSKRSAGQTGLWFECRYSQKKKVYINDSPWAHLSTLYPHLHLWRNGVMKWSLVHTWAKKSRPALGGSKKLPPGPGSDGGSLRVHDIVDISNVPRCNA